MRDLGEQVVKGFEFVRLHGQYGDASGTKEQEWFGRCRTSQHLLELWQDLERMGYIRRRGNYLSVVPPLFAARLVEELASTQDDSMRTLFNALGKASCDRFLERMVTVDLPEKSTFWDFVFGANGPLENGSQTADSFDHIDCLARAVPARTARFLEAKFNDQTGGVWIGNHLISTFRELVHEDESCVVGMRCLELLALREIEQIKKIRETQLFCECFVDWNHDFPMSYRERGAWIERLLKSEHKTHRLLGARIVVFVTAPPQSLSGYTVTALGRTNFKPRSTMLNQNLKRRTFPIMAARG